MFKKELFGLEKNGDYKAWTITVTNPCIAYGTCVMAISHGKLDGAQTVKHETVTEGKQGRSVYEQAVMMAEARVKKQIDKGYRETKEELNDLPLLAMLASDYNKVGHRIKFPCYTSVKYDGVRCIAKKKNGVVHLESRTGQEFIVPHIQETLTDVMDDGQALDGELYLHGRELQDILSAVKRTDPDKKIASAEKKVAKFGADYQKEAIRGHEYLTASEELDEAKRIKYIRENLEFHLFDIPTEGDFETRLGYMDEMYANYKHVPYMLFTQYQMCENDEQLKRQHAEAVKNGFEGVMLRNYFGVYESGKRSADLQKYKTFMDCEFEIIDIVPDKDGGGIFVLHNNVNELLFNCVMGTMHERKYQIQNKREFVGKWLTVKFQTRYKGTLLPQFPTGVQVRDGYKVGREFVPYD